VGFEGFINARVLEGLRRAGAKLKSGVVTVAQTIPTGKALVPEIPGIGSNTLWKAPS
jgi:hypothetical protein